VAGGARGFSLPQLMLSLVVVFLMALLVPAVAATLVNRSRVTRAHDDATRIAGAIHAFATDTGFAPALRRTPDGEAGPAAEWLDLIVGRGEAPRGQIDAAWTGGAVDTLENQLVVNNPGYATRSAGPDAGWRGPYLVAETPPDPWGNRYSVNVGAARRAGSSPARAVWALSAGPNGIIETPFTQAAGDAHLGGDDVGARVW
jgi:type II secretory pathway pseudopilin PulG